MCNCVYDEHGRPKCTLRERIVYMCDHCFKVCLTPDIIRPAKFDPEGKLVDAEACYCSAQE